MAGNNGVGSSQKPTARTPPPPLHRREEGDAGRGWNCSACDYRRTVQGTVSDGCRAVKNSAGADNIKPLCNFRRTRCPALSECGVSTHSIPAPRLPLPSVPHSALSRVKMNSVPTPSVLITLMFWLWALIISLTIDSPSPVPLRSFPREASIL